MTNVLSEEQKDVLTRMGVALLLVQTAEHVIQVCMTYVLQGDEPLSVETLERLTKKERKKPLGHFLEKLRARADLDGEFDSLLADFLEHRNILVHRFSDMPGYSMNTVEGRAAATAFLDRLLRETEEVTKIFLGLTRAWQEEVNLDIPFPLQHEIFAEIDAKYKTRIDDLFFEKDHKKS